MTNSVFTQAANATQAPATPQEPPEVQGADALANLVGEGKKFVSAEALAKGKLEADFYIKQLQDKLAAAEANQSRQSVVDELKEILAANQAATPSVSPPPASDPGVNNLNPEGTQVTTPTPAGVIPVENEGPSVEDLVKSRFDEQARKQAAEAYMKEKYGEAAPKAINEAAASSGLSVDQLRELAHSNLDHFKFVMEKGVANAGNPAPVNPISSPSVNSLALNAQTAATETSVSQQDKWDALRKSQGFLTGVQEQERFEEAVKMGNAFFSKGTH